MPRSKIPEIEAEYEMGFDDVVQGFAEDGESRVATAAILGYEPTYFCRLLRKRGLGKHFLPASETNSFKEAKIDREFTAKWADALAKSRDWKAIKVEYKGVLDSLSGHAKRLGLSRYTVLSRYRRNGLSKGLKWLFRKPERKYPWRK